MWLSCENVFQCVVCTRDCLFLGWCLVSENVCWELEKDVMDGTKRVLEVKREKRDEVWRRRERNGWETRGVSCCLLFLVLSQRQLSGLFFPPWQLTAGEQHQYQTAGCENPIEEFFHEPTECDVNDSGGNTPICRMCSVFDGECLGVLMKQICTWCGFYFISLWISMDLIVFPQTIGKYTHVSVHDNMQKCEIMRHFSTAKVP